MTSKEVYLLKKEVRNLTVLANKFSGSMLNKLYDKIEEGYIGWDDVDDIEILKEKLEDHVSRLVNGDYKQAIDIANLAMFLWNLNGQP